jgi:pimeloyl-ACP methyl ester carboxylesterase
MSLDLRVDDHQSGDVTTDAAPAGPYGRVVAVSLAVGLVAALLSTFLVFAGATEATITGAMLASFGLGWALLLVLTAGFTNRPQRWAGVPAVTLGATGLGLIATTPDSAAMTTMSWIWPAPMLVLAVFVWLRARRDLPGRGRWLLAPVVAVLALAPVAATYENIAVLRDGSTYAGPGRSYDVGGRELYLDCRGSGSPTVVLENGLGEVTVSWARVVAQVQATTRVCAYDRAGQGWSQDPTSPQDGIAAARDLHSLLRVAGEHGPYLLVGHSIGGTFAMNYAAEYPRQVAGMVLLDSSSPEQFSAIPSYASQYAVMHRVMALAPTLSRLGIGRLVAALDPSHLPTSDADTVTALTASAHGARNASADWSMLPTVFDQAQALTSLGDRPLAVLTTTENLQGTEGWAAAQDRLAGLSTTSVHRVVDATHVGLLADESGADAASRAIDDVVRTIRVRTHRSGA